MKRFSALLYGKLSRISMLLSTLNCRLTNLNLGSAANNAAHVRLSLTQHILSIPFALEYIPLKNNKKVEICVQLFKRRRKNVK